jgi:RND family efflux transporter MFP subunit
MSLDQDALGALRKDGSGGPSRYDTRKDQRRRRWIIGAGLAVAALAAWFVFGGSRQPEVTVVTVQPPSAPGETAVLSASGYVVARRLATVSSKVTGRILEVQFEEGTHVASAQVLARLDDSTVRAAYDVATRQLAAARTAVREVEVRLAEANRERDRLRELRKDNLVSVSALDAAEAEASALAARLESARAEVGVAEGTVRVRAQELDDFVIRAPFAGVIISKDAQPGEMVSPISAGGGFTRTGIATVVDMDSREIEVDVNEAYINRVGEGQRAEAVLDAYPDWKIPCRVIAIVPTADRQKATVRVRIAIEELDERILPDMGVRVRFYEESTPAAGSAVARVPSGAVAADGAGEYVWRVVESRVARQPVRLGREMDDLREVLEGLAPGDSVVLDPPAGLEDGARIVVRGSG